jgi:hypothetical protein
MEVDVGFFVSFFTQLQKEVLEETDLLLNDTQ